MNRYTPLELAVKIDDLFDFTYLGWYEVSLPDDRLIKTVLPTKQGERAPYTLVDGKWVLYNIERVICCAPDCQELGVVLDKCRKSVRRGYPDGVWQIIEEATCTPGGYPLDKDILAEDETLARAKALVYLNPC